jgi:hypothetical protein
VDENGKPMDTGVDVTEGHFVSITDESYRKGYMADTPGGKFDLRAGPCHVVKVFFGMPGYRSQDWDFGSMLDVPKPLHIVMRKLPPATLPVPPTPVGEFEIDGAAEFGWADHSVLHLMITADGAARATTTLDDRRTKVNSVGTWRPSDDGMKDRITVVLRQPDGSPDPMYVAQRPLTLDVCDDGARLLWKERGLSLHRVK